MTTRFLYLLLAGLLLASASRAQVIDTESATRYWQITDALRRNEPLTDQVWNDFLALPANKVYIRECFDGEQDLKDYRRALEVVYMPRYDSLRQVRVKAGRWYYVLANRYKEHEQEYRNFLRETLAKPAYLEQMYTYAYEYLPARNHTRVANLQIGYVALGNDATSQDEGMFFSLDNAIRTNAIKPGSLEAHEMHHQLLSGYKLTCPVQPSDESLVWLLRMALVEGLADLTDKKAYLENPANAAEYRAWGLTPTPAALPTPRLDYAGAGGGWGSGT